MPPRKAKSTAAKATRSSTRSTRASKSAAAKEEPQIKGESPAPEASDHVKVEDVKSEPASLKPEEQSVPVDSTAPGPISVDVDESKPEVSAVKEEASGLMEVVAPEAPLVEEANTAIPGDVEMENEVEGHTVAEDVAMETEAAEPTPAASAPAAPAAPSMTKEERQAKLEQLRSKMQSAAQANRKDVIEEHQRAKTTARDIARLEKQRRLAETLREKADAEETGADLERKKNWEYTIEENEVWEKRKVQKERRADFHFHNDAHQSRKRYKKDLGDLKPDLEAYNRQRELALGLEPGSLDSKKGSSQALVPVASGSGSALQAAASEDLYRDANSLVYADNKPSEEAIDRVVSKLNKDIDNRNKFSRQRLNEDEGDITYINERNRQFNKKIGRFYDKYTSEIRASFERGTAL